MSAAEIFILRICVTADDRGVALVRTYNVATGEITEAEKTSQAERQIGRAIEDRCAALGIRLAKTKYQ